jgi:hypothetical protein
VKSGNPQNDSDSICRELVPGITTLLDFSLLLTDVTTSADEVDSQLKQTITSFIGQAAASTA